MKRAGDRLPALIFFACLAVGAVALFVAASLRAPAARPIDGRPTVAATIFPIYDIARRVAGSEADVMLVLPPNAEPHSFEPPPSLIAALTGARAIYAVGHGLDDWIDPIVAAAGTRKVVVDRGIDLLAAEQAIADPAVPSADEVAGPDDPHYWLSLPNAQKIARTIAADLAAGLPPARADAVRANLAGYLGELAAADARVRGLLANVKNRDIIVFHGAWYYFCREYGLKVAGNFEPTAGREPTPRYLAALKEAAARSRARVIYTEPLFDPGLIRSFAADNGLRLAAIDDIGGVPGRDTLIDLVIYDAQTIKDNQ